eukprot:713872-Prorocentrum_minimum.AAC.2
MGREGAGCGGQLSGRAQRARPVSRGPGESGSRLRVHCRLYRYHRPLPPRPCEIARLSLCPRPASTPVSNPAPKIAAPISIRFEFVPFRSEFTTSIILGATDFAEG